MFSTLEKWSSTHHVLPLIPPQIHHDLPPRFTTNSAKPPAKSTFTTPIKKSHPWRSRLRTSNPKQRLTNGKGALKFRNSGVRFKSRPQARVFGPTISAGGKEQAGRADGKVVKVLCISSIRPCATVENIGIKTSDDGTHARTILKLIIPDAFK